MRQIRCRSLHGQAELDIPDAKLGVRIIDGEVYPCTDEQATVLLSNPNFVDATTGKNPNFVCASCGNETYVTALYQPKGNPMHPATTLNGVRHCPDCLQHPVEAVHAHIVPSPAYVSVPPVSEEE